MSIPYVSKSLLTGKECTLPNSAGGLSPPLSVFSSFKELEVFSDNQLPESAPADLANFPLSFMGESGESSLFGPESAIDSLCYKESQLPESAPAHTHLSDIFPADSTSRTLSARNSSSPASPVARATSMPELPARPDLNHNMEKKQITAYFSQYTALHWGVKVYNEDVYLYDSGYWTIPSPSEFGRLLDRQMKSENDFDLATYLDDRECKSILNKLKITSQFLSLDPIVGPIDMINCSDGVLDLQYDPPRRLSHNPDYNFTYRLSISCKQILRPDYGENYERFIAQVSDGSALVRTQLSEIVYAVITGAQIKGVYVLTGPPGCGKSQFIKVLENMVGPKYSITFDSIKALCSRFGSGSLSGKRLASCTDLPDQELTAAEVSKIKQLSGIDAAPIEKKYQDATTLSQKPILVFASNFPIRARNFRRDPGLMNRFASVIFTSSVNPSEKVEDFYKVLLAELPYIVRQAIDIGYPSLKNSALEPTKGSPPDDFEAISEDALIDEYIEQCVELCSGSVTPTMAFFNHFSTWCNIAVSATSFSRKFAWIVRGRFGINPTQIDGNSKRGYVGLQIRPSTSDLLNQ